MYTRSACAAALIVAAGVGTAAAGDTAELEIEQDFAVTTTPAVRPSPLKAASDGELSRLLAAPRDAGPALPDGIATLPPEAFSRSGDLFEQIEAMGAPSELAASLAATSGHEPIAADARARGVVASFAGPAVLVTVPIVLLGLATGALVSMARRQF